MGYGKKKKKYKKGKKKMKMKYKSKCSCCAHVSTIYDLPVESEEMQLTIHEDDILDPFYKPPEEEKIKDE